MSGLPQPTILIQSLSYYANKRAPSSNNLIAISKSAFLLYGTQPHTAMCILSMAFKKQDSCWKVGPGLYKYNILVQHFCSRLARIPTKIGTPGEVHAARGCQRIRIWRRWALASILIHVRIWTQKLWWHVRHHIIQSNSKNIGVCLSVVRNGPASHNVYFS